MKIIRLRGKLKGLFFILRLDLLVPVLPFRFLAQMARLSRWISRHRRIEFCDFYSFSFNYSRRLDLFEYVINREKLDSSIDYLEFGVAKGGSFKWWLQRIQHPDARFYGFDTFTGLPEDWGPFKKGEMSNNDEIPVFNDPRHTFFQGLFQQTLTGFLASYDPGKRKVIHMDADIYSASLYVLTLITPYLRKGDIIFFDEFNVPMHEFKAFSDWTESFYIDYEVLGSVNNFYQTAILIK